MKLCFLISNVLRYLGIVLKSICICIHNHIELYDKELHCICLWSHNYYVGCVNWLIDFHSFLIPCGHHLDHFSLLKLFKSLDRVLYQLLMLKHSLYLSMYILHFHELYDDEIKCIFAIINWSCKSSAKNISHHENEATWEILTWITKGHEFLCWGFPAF